MKMHLCVRTRVPPPPVDGSPNVAEMQFVLAIAEGMTWANVAYFQAHPESPCCLGCAGVRYVPPEACETPASLCQYADTAPEILATKEVTCLGAAPYSLAKMWLKGQPGALLLAPIMVEIQGQEVAKPRTYHLVIQTPSGEILDPVAELEEIPGVGQCLSAVCEAS